MLCIGGILLRVGCGKMKMMCFSLSGYDSPAISEACNIAGFLNLSFWMGSQSYTCFVCK